MEYKFRKCSLDDFDFLFMLKKQNFKKYVDNIWGWNDEVQKARLKEDLDKHLQHKHIIIIDNKMVGVYAWHITEEGNFFINEINIIKEYQNKGIGSNIIKNTLDENRKNKVRTILQIFKDNPAKILYERLGFKVYSETDTHYQMECLS